MRLIKCIALCVILCAAALAGCKANAPITNAPANTVVEKVVAANPTIASNLQDAAWNLDQAIGIGVLQANDPAAQCVHTTLQGAGVETVAGQPGVKSFTPRTGNPAADGAILYIRAQQAAASSGQTLALPQGCYGIIGKIVVDGMVATATAASAVVPGGGTLLSIIKAQ